MTEDTASQTTTPATYPSGEDLARLRAIAEEGRRSPLLGGRYLIVWGALIALAALINWAMVTGLLDWPPYALAISWFGLMAAGWVVSTLFGRGQAQRPGPMTTGNKVEYTVWMTLGLFLGALAASIFLYMQLGDPATLDERAGFFAMMAPVGFGTYAIALNASAVAGDEPRLKPFVGLSIAFAVATVLMLGQGIQLLTMAAGLIAVSVIPGAMLVAAEKARG